MNKTHLDTFNYISLDTVLLLMSFSKTFPHPWCVLNMRRTSTRGYTQCRRRLGLFPGFSCRTTSLVRSFVKRRDFIYADSFNVAGMRMRMVLLCDQIMRWLKWCFALLILLSLTFMCTVAGKWTLICLS